MEIRNNAEALEAFLGVPSSSAASSQRLKKGDASTEHSGLTGDQAVVSSAGAEVSLAAGPGGVRSERVAAVQRALAAGTYNVPAAKVADKLIDSMLTGDVGSSK